MTPEVLAWDDASNNRLLASGRGSWIHNPISAYRTIEGQNKELADKIFVQLSPKGPATPAVVRELPRLRRHQVLARTQDGGQGVPRGAWPTTIKDGVQGQHRLQHARSSRPSPRAPLPIISEDPKLKLLEQDAEYHFTTGYPGPLTPCRRRGLPAVRHGRRRSPSSAPTRWTSSRPMKWGEDKIKAIYAKF